MLNMLYAVKGFCLRSGCCPVGPSVCHSITLRPKLQWRWLSLTWNVRGVRNKIKHTAVLTFLMSQRAYVIVLVETHVTGHLQAALKRPWIGWAYHREESLSSLLNLPLSSCSPYKRTDRADICSCMLPWVGLPFWYWHVISQLAFIPQYPMTPSVWMCDFNMTMIPTLDRPMQTGAHATAL